MKKILFTIAIIITMVCSANAQSDGYFRGDAGDYEDRGSGGMPVIPYGDPGDIHGDQPGAPLGSGLLVLTALGAGYAFLRKREE